MHAIRRGRLIHWGRPHWQWLVVRHGRVLRVTLRRGHVHIGRRGGPAIAAPRPHVRWRSRTRHWSWRRSGPVSWASWTSWTRRPRKAYPRGRTTPLACHLHNQGLVLQAIALKPADCALCHNWSLHGDKAIALGLASLAINDDADIQHGPVRTKQLRNVALRYGDRQMGNVHLPTPNRLAPLFAANTLQFSIAGNSGNAIDALAIDRCVAHCSRDTQAKRRKVTARG